MVVAAALLATPFTVAAQSTVVFAIPGDVNLMTGGSALVSIETRDSGGSLTGGGTLNWGFNGACTAADWGTPPAAADASGTTTATMTAVQRGSCELLVIWDPDGAGTGTAVQTPLDGTAVNVAPILTFQALSGPASVVAAGTDASTIRFSMRALGDGQPEPGVYVELAVTDPSGDNLLRSVCTDRTDANGEYTFGLNEVIPSADTSEAGSWVATIRLTSIGCEPAKRRLRGKGGAGPQAVFPFQIQPATLSIVDPPGNSRIAVGAPTTITAQVDVGGSPASGQGINYSANDSSGPIASGTVTTNASGQATFDITPTVQGGVGITASLAIDPMVVANHMLQAENLYTFSVVDPAGGEATVPPSSPVSFVLSVVDAQSNPVPNHNINIGADPPIAGLPTSVQTNASGVATISFMSPASIETFSINVTHTGPFMAPRGIKVTGFTPLFEQIRLIVVNALVANPDDFTTPQIDGPAGGTTASVYANDTYNGAAPMPDSLVTSTITGDGGLTGVGISALGNLTVPAGSAGGNYLVAYQVCENAAPANCSSSTAQVSVRGPVRTLVKSATNESPSYPSNVGSIGVQALDDGSPASDTVVFTIVSGPVILVDGSDVGSPHSVAAASPSGIASLSRRHTGTGLSVVTAHRLSDPSVSQTFQFETYQFLMSDSGTATTAVPGQTIALKAQLRRQGASTTAATGAANAVVFTQTGGPTAVSPGASSEVSAGNYDSMVTLSAQGTYTFEARFTDPSPPSGLAPQSVVVPYTVTVATVSMALAASATPASIAAPSPITYTHTLTNTGAGPLTSVVLSHTLPNGSVATLTGPSGDGGVPGVLEVGEVWIYTTQYTATQADINGGGPLTSSATATALSANLPVSSNTATTNVTVTPPLRTLASVSGDGQQGAVNSTLSQPLVVVARNNGTSQAGVAITWTAGSGAILRTPGGATGSTVTTTSAADGSARVEVILGSTPGTITITASRDDAPGTSVGFVVTATGAAPVLALVRPSSGSGDGTSGAPGTSLPVAVLATRNGRPESGVEVIWNVLDTNSSASPARSTSGADGIAHTQILLAPTGSGPIRVRATRADGAGLSVFYTLTITAPTQAETFTAVSGDGQSGAPGTTLSDLVVSYIRNGAPVVGAAVTWRVASGDASLIGSTTATTGSDGTARIGVRLGAGSGSSTVIASTGTLSARFNLSATSARAVSLRLVSGDLQRGPAGSHADAPLVVKTFELVDGVERAVVGQDIAWSVVSGSATFDGGGASLRTTTGADGLSSLGYTFGPNAGAIRFQAQLVSTSQTVSINATSFLPNLRIVSGNNQRTTVGTALPLPLVVGIGDPGTAKALSGVAINWRVVGGGGQLGGATTTTAADGTASNTLRLGSSAGDNVIEASLADGTRVQFNATGVVAVEGARFTIISGSGQRLATNEVSAPLVVQLVDANNVGIRGARVVWTADNASTADALTITGVDGRTQTTAVLFDASGGTVTATLENTSISLAFALNGGVVETTGLGPNQMRNAELVDALCPALAARQAQGAPLSAGEADLLARCLEIEDSAGPRPQEVQQALTELVTQIATVLSEAALDTLRTQLGNHVVRFDQLRAMDRGGVAQNLGIGLMTRDGLVSLSLLPSSLTQNEAEGEGGGEAGAQFDRWGFFATGVIGRGESRSDSRTPEYDFDTSGLTAGVDYRFNDRIVGGASLGFARHDTELADDRGNLDTSGWTMSGYATWYNDKFWFVDGVLSYGSNSYDLLRRIRYDITAVGGGRTVVDQIATADTDSTQLGGSLSVGRDFQKGAWSLSTYLRGDYGRISFDGYTERAIAGSEGEGLVLTVDPRDLTSMAATLGGKATYVMSRDWGILMPHVQLELQQEFKDDPQRLATRFTFDPTQTTAIFEGQEIDSSLYNVGLGLSALFPGGKSAYVYYERLMGSSQIRQDTLSLGVRIEF